MPSAEFDAIPDCEKYPIDGLYEALIDRNKRIGHEVYEQPERFKELMAGQRMLIQLGVFDSQVKNGGITQYFWNYAESIFDVADWIEALNLPELQANYDRALETLVGKKDQWIALRAEWNKRRDNPKWEAFQQTYELLDLAWFENAYFDKHGYNEQQKWVRQSFGLHHAMQVRLVEYVRAHRTEFIIE
ncbi:MAG: DMP19 family protein [Planctomycetaceae bacterium]